MQTETALFELDLWDWSDDPNGRLFLAVIDALSDRTAAVLEKYSLSYFQITSGEPVYLPVDAPEEARHAVRAAMTVARVSAFSQHILVGADADTTAMLRKGFTELFMAGALHHSIDPDLINEMVELRAARALRSQQQARTSDGGKAHKPSEHWRSIAEPIFDDLWIAGERHKPFKRWAVRIRDVAEAQDPGSTAGWPGQQFLKAISDWQAGKLKAA